MSIRYLAAAMNVKLGGSEKLVLIYLANLTHDELGYAWPSMEGIANFANISRRSAERTIKSLKESGYITVKLRDHAHKTSEYRLCLQNTALYPTKEAPDVSVGGSETAPDASVGDPPDASVTQYLKKDTLPKEIPNGISKKKLDREQMEGDFEAFWMCVPRKVAKANARRAYFKAREHVDAPTILSAMQRYAEERRNKDQQYTVHPATWLNHQRWMDEAPEPAESTGDAFMRMFKEGSEVDDTHDGTPAIEATTEGYSRGRNSNSGFLHISRGLGSG